MNNILVILMLAYGDVIRSTPVVKGLRQQYPQAKITFLTDQASVPLLHGNPHLNEVISLPRLYWKKTLTGGGHLGDMVKEIYTFCMELKSRQFDLVINLQFNTLSTILSYFSGFEKIIGPAWDTKGNSFLYGNEWVKYTWDCIFRGKNRAENTYNLCDLWQKMAGVSAEPSELFFYISDLSVRRIEKMWKENQLENKTVVTMIPGAGWRAKRWPEDYYALLANRLMEETGASIVLCGAKEETEPVKRVESHIHHPVLNLCGKTSFHDMAAVMKKSSKIVVNDSMALHLGCAVKTPGIVFFGPTSPKDSGPYGFDKIKVLQSGETCSPCFGGCADMPCMRNITVDMAFEVLNSL